MQVIWKKVYGVAWALILVACFSAHANQSDSEYEQQLIGILESIYQGNMAQALAKTEAHLQRYEKSRIGYLIKADLILSKSANLASMGALSSAQKLSEKDAQYLDGLKKQIQSRWRHTKQVHHTLGDKVPAALIDMGKHEHVIVSDMRESRLYLYRNNNGRPELVKDYYMSVGSQGYGKQIEGDNKTPIGVYSIVNYIDGSELPDLYGEGAFPVDYPNKVDAYRRRTGYGIWLHGTPSDTYARAPWASEGCFVISNDDFLDISRYLSVKEKTPVVLADGVEWVNWDELKKRREDFLGVLDGWKQDWESLNTDAYLDHYQREDFNFGQTTFEQWAQRKRAVNNGKTFIQVDLDIDSMFVYPGEENTLVVRYTQRYLSNNYHGESFKEQFWKQGEDGQWRIIYEG